MSPKVLQGFYALLLAAAVAACQLMFLLPVGLHRLIAKDEGFYLLAAKLVLQGQRPYLDFFYPQMPLLPYVYGAWFSHTGVTWHSARYLAVLLTVLSGVLLFQRASRLFGLFYGVTAVVLFCASALVFTIYTTATTYSLSTLLLFGAYMAVADNAHALSRLRLVSGGILLGLAIGVRLPFAGAYPALLLYLLLKRRSEPPRKLRAVWLFSLGLAAALLPWALLAAASPEVFYFNNFGYHLLRSDASPAQAVANQIQVLGLLFGLRPGIKYESFQFPLLLYLSLAALPIFCLKRRMPDAAFFIAAALFLVNFLPRPVYVQYFAVLVPFLILGALYTVHALIGSSGGWVRAGGAGLALAALAIYLRHVNADIINYTVTGKGVIGILTEKRAQDWNLERAAEISGLINDSLGPRDRVVSFWPGYLVPSHGAPFPGSENQFGMTVAEKLGPGERARYKTANAADLRAALTAGEAAVAVFPKASLRPELQAALHHGGYRVFAVRGEIVLFRKPLRDVEETAEPAGDHAG